MKLSKLIEWIVVFLMGSILYFVLEKFWILRKKPKIIKVEGKCESEEPEAKKLLRAPFFVQTLPEGTSKELYENNYKKVLKKKINENF